MMSTRRAIAAIVLFTVVLRLPALILPQPIDDEAIYSVVANEIVHGGHPYIDAIERKPPLLFWTYAAVFKFAGEYNWLALHIVGVAWVLATMAALFVLARQLFNDERAGLAAAFLYSLYQPWGLWKNLSFDGEVLMLLPVAWAWVIVLGPSRSRARLELLLAGALLCAAFLLKQPAAGTAVPLGLYLLHPRYRAARRFTATEALTQAAIFSAGFFGALAGVAAVLQMQGILPEAYFWTITHHKLAHFFWNRAAENTLGFAAASLPLLIAAVASFRSKKLWAGLDAERFAVEAWLLVAAVGVAAGERFYPQHYIQLLPPLALFAAPVLSQLWRGAAGRTLPSWLTPKVMGTWMAVTAAVFLTVNAVGMAMRYPGSEAGRYLREHAPPGARLFVWGQGTGIYLDARLRPASRYVATYPLTGYLFGPDTGVDTTDRIVPGAWDNFEKDLQAHPPDFIVDDEVDAAARNPIARFPRMARLIMDHYQVAAALPGAVVYQRTAP